MMGWRWGFAALLLGISGCKAPVATLLTHAGPNAPGMAHVTLQLTPARQLLALNSAGAPWARLTTDGPDLASSNVQMLALSSGVSLEAYVPIGTQRILTLQYLDGQQQPIPGGIFGAVGAVTIGNNAFTLDAANTAASQVASQILANDRANKTQILSKLNLATLPATLSGYGQQLALPSLDLLDTSAIASDTYAASGVPAVQSAFADTPGRLVVQASGLPVGTGFVATLSDPVSQPVKVSQDAEATIGPVASGTWTLTVTPTAGGLSAQSVQVSVPGGQTIQKSLAFGTTTAATALPWPLAAGAAVTLPQSGSQVVWAIGGTTYSDANGLSFTTGLLEDVPTSGWSSGPALTNGLFETTATTVGNQIYWFGGNSQSGLLKTTTSYNPSGANNQLVDLAPIPGASPVFGASAGAIGSTIYLAGGRTDFAGSGFPSTQAYDTSTNSWSASTLPVLPTLRAHMASMVVGNNWYLFGGTLQGSAYSNSALGNTVTQELAQNDATVFTPGPPAKYTVLAPMPTARSAASALVYNGKIYVIGGAETFGAASAAIEIYNPATNTWTQHAPLQTPRAMPLVWLNGNQIVVAGGLDGADAGSALPLATVETVTP